MARIWGRLTSPSLQPWFHHAPSTCLGFGQAARRNVILDDEGKQDETVNTVFVRVPRLTKVNIVWHRSTFPSVIGLGPK